MPKLLIHRKKPNPVPPCGKRIVYQVPHSPFQKLIEAARLAHQMSYRELAEELGVEHSTLWQWLHTQNGVPHARSFKDQHLASLSRALKIPVPQIKEAFDASRHRFTAQEDPAPTSSTDALEGFIEALGNDKRERISKQYALNLAKTFLASAKSGNFSRTSST
jgi:transcriptional regulator with XRE-family HTH domain